MNNSLNEKNESLKINTLNTKSIAHEASVTPRGAHSGMQGARPALSGLRNSTNFPSTVTTMFHSIRQDKSDPLKYHQRIVLEYMTRYPDIRGLLIYHSMGSGKTKLAASITETLLQSREYKRVIFLSMKSLHANFRGDLEWANKTINPGGVDFKKYSFITLTANNMMDQLRQAVTGSKVATPGRDLVIEIAGSVIVIDEAHNLFNGVSNGSANYAELYDTLTHARGVKIIFLSGSPIMNDPFELMVCFNMLAGSVSGGRTLFSENYDDFIRYFTAGTQDVQRRVLAEGLEIAGAKLMPKNLDKFMDRIVGLVSYYDIRDANPEVRSVFPTVLPVSLVRVPMSQTQFAEYSLARGKEIKENIVTFEDMERRRRRVPGRLEKPKGSTSSYRVRSRQFSNVVYPAEAINIRRDANSGNMIYERIIHKLPANMFDPGTIGEHSCKFLAMIKNIISHLPDHVLHDTKLPMSFPGIAKSPHLGPGIVYSQFLDAGLAVFAKMLEHYGFVNVFSTPPESNTPESNTPESNTPESNPPESNPPESNPPESTNSVSAVRRTAPGRRSPAYAIISGEVDPRDRERLLSLTQSPENVDGSRLALLLLSSAAAEGITTKYMKHVHLMEPFWNTVRIDQVIARAARLDSHSDLPPESRYVCPYLYLADYPENIDRKKIAEEYEAQGGTKGTLEDTTDISVYTGALQSADLNNAFLNMLKAVSIDCVLHAGDSGVSKCRMCMPTGKPFYLDDFYKDMNFQSPCQKLMEKKVTAEKIEYDGRGYMYRYDDSGDLHIYRFNEKLAGYEELPVDDELYVKIAEIIRARKPPGGNSPKPETVGSGEDIIDSPFYTPELVRYFDRNSELQFLTR